MTQWRVRVMDLGCLAALLLAIASPSVWGRLYFGNNSPSFLGLALVVVLAGAVALPWLVSVLSQRLSFVRLLRTMILMLAAVWLAVMVGGGTLPRTPPTVLVPTVLIAGLGGWSALHSAGLASWWPRCCGALLVAALTFVGASPLLGHVVSDDLALLPPVTQDKRLPTLWILLDETSFGAGEKLTQPLRELGLHVTLDALKPAGQNTLDIVPSMFTRQLFGADAAPCAPHALCSSRHALDFSRVSVGRAGVDLVGVYHPYCATRGWRSCAMHDGRRESWAQQWNELLCTGSRWLGTEAECLRAFAVHDLAVRAHAIKAIQSAPFWQLGGDLFVHILLPHLPASASPQPSLAVAYETNIDAAAQLLQSLGQRLKGTFPDFRLVVFSDHPLRAIDRCNSAYSGRCERPVQYSEPFLVPLIVASPVAVPLRVPPSNLTIFDIDLALSRL